MSDRAEMGLDELLRRLESRLEGKTGRERHRVETDLAWCLVERGELGQAFRHLWNAEKAPGAAQAHQLARGELQAYCGNEEAALALLADREPGDSETAMVRARIAASRGDWALAHRHAQEASGGSEGQARALLLAARAEVERERLKEAQTLLRQIEPASKAESLAVEGLMARCASEDASTALTRVIERSREEGAQAQQADAWADLARALLAQGESEKARRASVAAVELWEDIAMTLPPPLRAGFWCDARRQAIRATSKRARGPAAAPSMSGVAPLLRNLRRLASERDLSKLLALITDGAVAITGAERGFVLLVDEDGALEPRTIRGAEDQLGKQSAAFSRSIAETVLIDREPVVTVDAAHDARVQDYMSVHQLMLKSVACLPIETRGRTWGVLYLEHRSASGRFSGTDLALLRAYADQAAIAIETSSLIDRVEAQKRDLQLANEALRDVNQQLEQRLHGQAETLEQTKQQIARLQGSTAEGERWGLVGVSEGMRRVYEVLHRVSSTQIPVAVSGESGTGKELVARAIHRGSPRAGEPFVSLSCGAIPESLLESELFGHLAGAFTGATHARDGVFVQAHGGTLFMDEIADMPPRMQLDLLRVLQEGRVRPVGAAEERPVDVRLVTACKQPLRELVEEGKLREDLYYRLAVVELKLPPLRERRPDVPLLCDHFLQRIAKERSEPRKRLSRDAMQRLTEHSFPGNVRELEHLLINASVFATGETIEAEELAIESPSPTPSASGELHNFQDFKSSERERILATLNAHGWNRAQAARSLGMPRRTFYRRLKEHGIALPTGKG